MNDEKIYMSILQGYELKKIKYLVLRKALYGPLRWNELFSKYVLLMYYHCIVHDPLNCSVLILSTRFVVL